MSVRQCDACFDEFVKWEHTPRPPELTCTLTTGHKGLHVDPDGVLWAPNTQEGYRRATEM